MRAVWPSQCPADSAHVQHEPGTGAKLEVHLQYERKCKLSKPNCNKKKAFLFGAHVAIGFVLAMHPAQAVNGGELLDYNNDGAYSADEAETFQTILFFTLDHNRDLRISYQEFLLVEDVSGERQRLKPTPEDITERFELIDVNDDRAISLEEFLADGARRFNTYDWNRDGRITTNEQPLPP